MDACEGWLDAHPVHPSSRDVVAWTMARIAVPRDASMSHRVERHPFDRLRNAMRRFMPRRSLSSPLLDAIVSRRRRRVDLVAVQQRRTGFAEDK